MAGTQAAGSVKVKPPSRAEIPITADGTAFMRVGMLIKAMSVNAGGDVELLFGVA
jgi:hypothetical protein